MGSNQGEGQVSPCLSHPTPLTTTSPTTPTQPSLPPDTRCTRAAPTPTEEATSTTTTILILTPTLSQPTWLHLLCPLTTSITPSSTPLVGGRLREERPLQAARRRRGTSSMRR